jgi:hypothetical protein
MVFIAFPCNSGVTPRKLAPSAHSRPRPFAAVYHRGNVGRCFPTAINQTRLSTFTYGTLSTPFTNFTLRFRSFTACFNFTPTLLKFIPYNVQSTVYSNSRCSCGQLHELYPELPRITRAVGLTWFRSVMTSHANHQFAIPSHGTPTTPANALCGRPARLVSICVMLERRCGSLRRLEVVKSVGLATRLWWGQVLLGRVTCRKRYERKQEYAT